MPVSDVAGTSTNLRVLQPSRRKPAVGDVFVMQLPDGRYVFGRVIKTDAQSGFGPPNAVLIYVYRERYETKTPPEPSELSPDRLLISPLMVNRLPWSKGYFETVASWPLSSGDVLDQHCFRDWTGKYFDDQGNELPGPIEPVGDYGLHSYRSVDDQVSDALGLERAPD